MNNIRSYRFEKVIIHVYWGIMLQKLGKYVPRYVEQIDDRRLRILSFWSCGCGSEDAIWRMINLRWSEKALAALWQGSAILAGIFAPGGWRRLAQPHHHHHYHLYQITPYLSTARLRLLFCTLDPSTASTSTYDSVLLIKMAGKHHHHISSRLSRSRAERGYLEALANSRHRFPEYRS